MNTKQVWEHLNRKYANGVERATFLHEVSYHRKKLISYETSNAVYEVLNTPICTGVSFGMQARQLERARELTPEEKEIEKINYRKILEKEWEERVEAILRNVANDPLDLDSFRPY